MLKPTTEVSITIEFDIQALSRVPDARLAMLWHLAQANPAPHGDKQAGEIVNRIGEQIIRRWLANTQPEMHHHQHRTYYWHQLCRFAVHRDDDWHPDSTKLAEYYAGNDVSPDAVTQDGCPRNVIDGDVGQHFFKKGALSDSPIACVYCGAHKPEGGGR